MTDEQELPTGEPQASRPHMPEGYGVPEDGEGMLPWSWAEERLEQAINYWVASTRPDGRPHVTPIWGVWLDRTFYFEGGPDTRRGRNIAANPAVAVHVEQGDDIVIVEGRAVEVSALEESLSSRLVEAFGSKYEPKYKYRPDPKMWEGGGLYAVSPRLVLAWSKFPRDTTRWKFG